MQTPEFQRSSGVFLFQEEAKLVGLKQTIRPYSRDCFQKPGMFHCKVFTSFFYSTLHYFT